MARISGLEKKQAPWHLRWFYGVMRKMFGKDFTPAKIQMRLPALVWGGSHGSRSRPQTTCFIALHSIGKSSGRGARRLPILNRRQLCRGQKSRLER